MIRCNAEGVDGRRDRRKSGRPSWLDDGQLATFEALVLRGPEPERDGVSSWRAKDLCRIVAARFGVVDSENGTLRLLHDLGLSWQKARCGWGVKNLDVILDLTTTKEPRISSISRRLPQGPVRPS